MSVFIYALNMNSKDVKKIYKYENFSMTGKNFLIKKIIPTLQGIQFYNLLYKKVKCLIEKILLSMNRLSTVLIYGIY